MYHIRDANELDTHYIFDIDLKVFEAAWTPDEWRKNAEHYRIQVCTYFGTPIAFVLFRETDGAVEIAKLAVKTAYRRRGVAGSMLETIEKWAIARNLRRLSLMVPEYMTDPSIPSNITEWLQRARFRATTPFVTGAFSVCGEPEDGIIFERSI